MRKLIFILSFFFVIFSFSPSIYEIIERKNLPAERTFVLEHNYMFDYNFYLSRIRQGMEGRWLVAEKYYNQPHSGSLFQVFYLFLGKLGGLGGLAPSVIYHASRVILGFVLLVLLGKFVSNFFTGIWQLVAYLFVVTAGSWPILVKVGNSFRFATYMGWWSVIDSLQRITIMPHILFGQIFLLLFIWRFSTFLDTPSRSHFVTPGRWPNGLLPGEFWRNGRWLFWGFMGFLVGIVFPPTLITVYAIFAVMTVLEYIVILNHVILNHVIPDLIRNPIGIQKLVQDDTKASVRHDSKLSVQDDKTRQLGITNIILPRIVFVLLSFPSLIYLQLMLKTTPWSALALFDVQHRMPIPYKEYFLALGPMLPLGVLGGLLVLKNREKKLLPVIAWVLGIFLLFAIFEKVPTQSPLRFTEAAIHIPLGILAVFLLQQLWRLGEKYRRRGIKVIAVITIITVITLGLGVMLSMVGWLTDQAYSKGKGTWLVPIGAQLVYPLSDFMDGIYYLRDNTDKNSVVLSYITAGNDIPAYAGNFVYIGHANTPDEKKKEKIAARFFKGEMTKEEAKEFLQKERISYIYFGPQEREVGSIDNLVSVYTFLTPIYNNSRVTIYK
ncbi:hypothetical protein HZB96_02700 [Candidatus Gottesmanbacteria bacterium]|nr:hypothetical protein [Candidatus Gottesmanbacteria bacterium]